MMFGYCTVDAYNDFNCKQVVRHVQSDRELVRHRIDGVWQPWKWANPEMLFNVEHPTLEMYNSKPVYCYMVSIGALPNASIKALDLVTALDRFVDATLIVHRSGDGMMFINPPFVTTQFGSNHPGLEWNTTWVDLTTSDNRSDYTGVLIIKYTKL